MANNPRNKSGVKESSERTATVPRSDFRLSPSVQLAVGCQGWNYDDWVTSPGDAPVFYPTGTRSAGMLEIYARAFQSVEVDSTFYAIPSAKTVENWARRVPDDFTFALKMPQSITHDYVLRAECRLILEEFCERALLLKNKLAAVLIQLPPQFVLTPENGQALKDFLPLLPREIRFAVEFRSNSWLHEKVVRYLNDFNVALAFVEGQWLARGCLFELAESSTADFAYLRWMGARDLTAFDSVVRPQEANLVMWAEFLQTLSGRVPRIDAYFSNFYEGHAPASANKLKALCGQTVTLAGELESQPSLF